MKKIKVLTAALTILLMSAFVLYQSVDWKVKEGYSVKVFRNSQLQFPIFFKGLKAEISFDKENPEKSKINAVIDATTVDTGNESMTAHAKEPSVLDTEKFPEITFKSSSVKKNVTGYEVTGNLTLKGITKEILSRLHLKRKRSSVSLRLQQKISILPEKGLYLPEKSELN